MLIRFALILVLLAVPATAAPLCRDLKGLYTPCPTGKAAPAPHAGKQHKEARDASASAALPAVITAAEKPTPVETGRSLVSHSKKLCRDIRGLYTPCPR